MRSEHDANLALAAAAAGRGAVEHNNKARTIRAIRELVTLAESQGIRYTLPDVTTAADARESLAVLRIELFSARGVRA